MNKKTTQVNLANQQLESWDWDNPVAYKLKKYYEAQSPTNSNLKDEIEKKNQLKNG
jgi:hypothetical protein